MALNVKVVQDGPFPYPMIALCVAAVLWQFGHPWLGVYYAVVVTFIIVRLRLRKQRRRAAANTKADAEADAAHDAETMAP